MEKTTQRGVSMSGALLIVVCLSAILATIQATWGPVYEEQCTEPTSEAVASAKKINDSFSSPFSGEYKAKAKCERVLVR